MPIFTKIVATLLRTAQFLGALYATGVCTYFIVELAKRHAWTGRTLAVEIISGAGLLWAAFTLMLTVCLLQKSFFQFFTIIGDILFVGGFVAVLVLIRNSWKNSCSANPLAIPWLARGGPNLNVNCQLVKGLFIVSIVLALLFLLTALIALIAHRSTKKDKAYGPSPSNNYTSGRGKKHGKHSKHEKHDVETATTTTGPALAPPVAVAAGRHSHDSKYTDATEKTGEGFHTTSTSTGPGREYLAPRAGYTGNDRTVSPVPSNHNLHQTNNSHAGQYAMAGALAGGAAAHHRNNKNQAYTQNDTLPNHPGPQDGTTEHIYNPEAERYPHHGAGVGAGALGAGALGAGAYNSRESDNYPTNTNSMFSELDNNTTTTGQSYATPVGQHNHSNNIREPNAYYPATANELDAQNVDNPHYWSTELDSARYDPNPTGRSLHELGHADGDKRFSDYQSPSTPLADHRREEEGYGYSAGPGMTGGGSNQVSTLPQLGREDQRRF